MMIVNHSRRFLGGLSVLIGLIFATMSFAQGTNGTITGLVSDSTGGAVANAQVVVTETTTGVTHKLTSGATGLFTVPFLPPGRYTVALTAAGFSEFKETNLVLQVEQTVRVDAQMKVGAATETLTVAAEAVGLDTDSSTIGQVITETQVAQLPLNGRNFEQLLLLGAGAVQTPGGQATTNRPGYGDVYNIGGGRDSSNGFSIDGVQNIEIFYNVPAIVLSTDALQEFKEQTKTYSAAYGGAANQVNLMTRSGANQIHGSAYEFLRNDAFDALNYFQKSGALLRQHEFGYSLGAPITIPKLYNGKDKTFVFLNYERLQIHQTSNQFGLVPTTNQISGLFATPIYDPDPTSATYKKLFPKNANGLYQIPANRFSNLANAAINGKYIPAPNVSLPQGNYQDTIATPTIREQQTYRLDQKLKDRDILTFRATLYDYSITEQQLVTPAGNVIASYNDHNYVATETHTFTPNIVNQFTFGYLDNTADTAGVTAPAADIAALKLQNTYPQAGDAFPTMSFNTGGFSPLGGAINQPSLYYQTLYEYGDSVSITKGRHTLQAGVDSRNYLIKKSEFDNPLGAYTYDGTYTAKPGTLPTGDNAIADLILGWPIAGSGYVPTPINPNPFYLNIVYKGFAAYINDDWKVSPKLTVNLGLRYDFQAVPYEQNNHWAWLDPNIAGGGLYVADKSIVAMGNGYYAYGGQTAGSSQKTPFAPRVGFSYRPLVKTVVRGGYGIFYDQYDLSEYESGAIYPYSVQVNVQGINTNNDFTAPSVTGVTLSDLGFNFLQPRTNKDPYIQNWSLSIERELTSNTKLDVNYTGSKGTHLEGRRLSNQALPYATPPTAGTPVVNPYPNLGYVIEGAFADWSNYHAASATIDHRSGNLYLLAAYTFAKSLDDKSASLGVANDIAGWAGPMDSAHPQRDYGRSSYDARQSLVASFVYQLPFGRGKKYGASIPKAADAVVGGWQFNGIMHFQTGLPFGISAPDTGNFLETFAQRANKVGNPYPSGLKRGVSSWFNTAAFTTPLPGVFGNSGRNIIDAPRVNDWDLAVAKNFPIYERLTFQFRGETFNTFNHPQFGYPDQGVTDGNFGSIGTANAPRQIQLVGKLTW